MKIYNLNELTESRLLYDKNPPKFMNYIILIVLFFVVSIFLISIKYTKTSIVSGKSILTTNTKTNIMPKLSGEVKNSNLLEGKKVKKNDLLLTIKSPEITVKKEELNGQEDLLENRLYFLKKTYSELKNHENTFDKNNYTESEFYNKIYNCFNKMKEFDIDENYLISQNYSQEDIKKYRNQSKLKKDQILSDSLLEISNEINSIKMEKDKISNIKSSINKSLNEYKIYASSDGTVHLNKNIPYGTVIQAGELLGTISDEDKELVFEAVISSSDIYKLKLDNSCYININGVSNSKFGHLDGTIVSIDNDSTIDPKSGEVFFKVKVKPNKNYLEDTKGNRIYLNLGMLADIQIKYDSSTYFEYFLDKIGFDIN